MIPLLGRAIVVLVLSAAAVAAQDGLAERVEAALDRARPVLLRELRRADGGPLALGCLAAAHDRVSDRDPVFARSLERLSKATLRDTYGLSLRLMVAAHVESFPAREATARRDAELLLRNQATSGGFSYSARPSDWDLSNTQYAALGLRAAIHLGHDVPLRVWQGIASATRRNQDAGGGFGYASHNGPTMSMTVAGIAVLELCRQQHDTADVERAIARGWAWMEKHVDAIGDLQSWHAFYAHYGLERAAVLSDRAQIGGLDWFRRGAESILALQRPSGGFAKPQTSGNATDAVDTAFAILFLRRSFQARLGRRGPVTPGPTRLCHELPADAEPDAIRIAVECDVDRGDAAVPDLLRALRSDLEVRRRAAAHALLRIAGQDFRYHPARSHEQNAAAVGRAERWWAERSGSIGR